MHLCKLAHVDGYWGYTASLMLYAKEKNPAFSINKNILSAGLLSLLIITGHLGVH